MYNPQLYDEISHDVIDRYNKEKKSNELKSIQTFLDNATNKYIKNKKDALEEFKTIKNNVKSENLKDIVNKLELAIFGYDGDDDGDDDDEPKYEENIAERTKMRRQNKKTDKKDASRTFAPPDPDSNDLNKWIVYDKEGLDSNDYNINGTKRNGYNINGYNINGYIFSYDKDGYNINGYDFSGLDRDCYNINGVKGVYDYKDKYVYSRYGFNKYGFNKNGYNREDYKKYGFNKSGYNRDGFNKYGFNKNGYNRDGFNKYGFNRYRLNKYGKKNIPGSGLKILTSQQMLARLPILLAQIKPGNNSLELKSEIRQLLYSLYRSKQISKTVYKNLIATI